MKSPTIVDQLAFTLWMIGFHALVLVPLWGAGRMIGRARQRHGV